MDKGGAWVLGERLRQARLAAGLSLQGLAAKLDRPISKQALSKYETGAVHPPPSRIAELAAALGLPASSMLIDDAVEIKWVAYRKLAKLSKSRQEKITAVATQRLESELKLRELFRIGEWHDLPRPINVQNLSDCEYAAAAVRMRWDLGYRPIGRLIELIEENGCAVIVWPDKWGFDGLSGWANRTPVLVLNKAVPSDRLRLNAAHEIGHLTLKSIGDAKQDEKFAFRFAAAFLVPAEAARDELGTHRRSLDLNELGLLKQRWGLSMQGWIRRAFELEIIGQDLYRTLNIQFRKAGWHRTEPFPYVLNESPTLFPRLVLRAAAEKMITSDEAERLYPAATQGGGQARDQQYSLRDLARRSPEERHQILGKITFADEKCTTQAWETTEGYEID